MSLKTPDMLLKTLTEGDYTFKERRLLRAFSSQASKHWRGWRCCVWVIYSKWYRFDLFEPTREPAMTAGKVKSREITPPDFMHADGLSPWGNAGFRHHLRRLVELVSKRDSFPTWVSPGEAVPEARDNTPPLWKTGSEINILPLIRSPAAMWEVM